ncbi:TRAP transporter small permease subunit [Aeromicrobium phragmitis]|uniref:TRAP transporter small permease subunit n=1 Tax=Aeromicrobium phragmitis TaxID=2478914 RepID=A0A3L8PMS1_9ACTN|nr:TRAP transporter small permease subunit [Aeromicrobium phragmitis]RLV55798.1 TRAP transporter small permease subunit [Aeromicrobium phragmitis]
MSQPSEPAVAQQGPPPERGPLRYIALAEEVIGGLLILVIFVFVLLQAVQRYLPGPTWVGAGELARFAMAVVTFALVGLLYGRSSHIVVRVIERYVRGRAARVLAVVTHVVVAFTAILLLNEAWLLFQSSGNQSTPALGLPMTWIYLLPLIGVALLLVRAVLAVVWPGSTAPDPQHDNETEVQA